MTMGDLGNFPLNKKCKTISVSRPRVLFTASRAVV